MQYFRSSMMALLMTAAMIPATAGQAADVASGATQVANQVAGSWLDAKAGSMPEWLSRVEFGWQGGVDKPEWNVLTVQPLYQSPDRTHTLFTQGSILRYDQFGDMRTTTNLGLGYRELVLDRKLMLGVNGFYDRDWAEQHERMGFGVEARSNPLEVNANYYDAFSGLQSISAGVSERALDGWDAEVGVQVPYLPWAKLFARTYEWQGVAGRDTVGQVYSARLQPTRWLEVEAGHDDNHTLGGDNFLRVNFSLNFAGETTTPLVDDKAFDFQETMEEKTLEKVRRENKIVVERITAGGGGGGGSFTVTVSRGT